MMSWERSITLKTTHEIEIMREAGKINAEALIAAKNAIQPGVTTADLDAAAAEVIRKHGAKAAFLGVPGAFPYPATTTISINDEMVHGIPSNKRKLVEGDIVSIDCGTILEGFVADFSDHLRCWADLRASPALNECNREIALHRN